MFHSYFVNLFFILDTANTRQETNDLIKKKEQVYSFIFLLFIILFVIDLLFINYNRMVMNY
jgi:hypothetical protein